MTEGESDISVLEGRRIRESYNAKLRTKAFPSRFLPMRDKAAPPAPPALTNFIRSAIDADLQSGRHAARRWAGAPDIAQAHRKGLPDPAKIRTRFAIDYAGRCHMRFDDTNPEKEEQEYVDSILDSVRWLGFSWADDNEDNLYFASDYFDHLYAMAEWLIEAGHAYVDSQSAEAMRTSRGTLTEPGRNSPFRDRSPDDNLRLFREMRDGRHPEGSHILRAKIDMASPNMNLRDPALYRIRFATHHRSGDKWCIYPMYDYAHPIEDALENITHSLCTLEFQDHRPLYDWLLERLAEGGFFDRPLPQQIEFARLNLTYTITSKRKLQELIRGHHVDGWDDPRMTTIVGLRRRGYTPEAIRLFCERIGVAKADSWVDMGTLEGALRDDLDAKAARAVAVLDPLKLVITNWPEGQEEDCEAPVHPHQPERGKRVFPISRELWIEREDFTETPPKGFFRLYPGNRVRLRYGYVIECTGCEKDAHGKVVAVHATYFDDSKSGTPGADTYKVKGNLHWVSAAHALDAEVRLYDRLYKDPQPGAGDTDHLASLNPDSKKVIGAKLEPTLANAQPDERFQFERHGYFVVDRVDSKPGALVFNRAVTLKDSWSGGKR
jgi:glutaminyl-tRNA synthetase